jgi:hypothetical protein
VDAVAIQRPSTTGPDLFWHLRDRDLVRRDDLAKKGFVIPDPAITREHTACGMAAGEIWIMKLHDDQPGSGHVQGVLNYMVNLVRANLQQQSISVNNVELSVSEPV